MTAHLAVLGQLSLVGPGAEALLARRRPLALLAVVAASTDPRANARQRGITRDQLLVLFWPESKAERARNSLSQALTAIRSALGEESIVGNATLNANPELISCDIWEYREAIAAGDWLRATTLRTGPFLDQCSIGGLPELDDWITGMRDRVDRQFIDAIGQLATESAACGDHRSAARYWAQAEELDPTLVKYALARARTLEAAGDLTEALAVCERYRARVREQLGVAADESMISYATELRERILRTPPASHPAIGAGERVPVITPATLASLPETYKPVAAAVPVVVPAEMVAAVPMPVATSVSPEAAALEPAAASDAAAALDAAAVPAQVTMTDVAGRTAEGASSRSLSNTSASAGIPRRSLLRRGAAAVLVASVALIAGTKLLVVDGQPLFRLVSPSAVLPDAALASGADPDDLAGGHGMMMQRATYDMMVLALAQLQKAEIYEARGDRARAIEHYDRFIELWSNADKVLHPVVAGVEKRRAALGRQ